MLLLITICINATIGVLFKLFKKYEIDNLQAIIVNYFTCVITGSLVVMRPVVTLEVIEKPWFWIACILSLLFISIFNVVALAVQKLGILVTTLFQKMSLVWPTLFGIICYSESTGLFKILGIGLAFLSIFLINYNPNQKLEGKQILGLGLVLAAATFIGSGIIEILLYYVKAENIIQGDDIEFTSTLFFLAGVNGLLYLLVTSIKKRPQVKMKNIIGGIALGIPNFFSIYWILLLLEQGWEGSTMFPMLNVGILVLNALIGIIIFKERFGLVRAIGFVSAIVAIMLLVAETI